MTLIDNELDLLESLVPLAGTRLVEAGCGAARLARELLERHPDAQLAGLEVDERQLAKNLTEPAPRLEFVRAGAQAIPFADASFDGELNELIRCFNDEGTVRAAAQQALDRAVAGGRWRQQAQQRFDMPVRFRDFADFEQRMMRPTFADHRIDDAMLQRVAALYAPHQRADGARFTRPMHVRLLRRAG